MTEVAMFHVIGKTGMGKSTLLENMGPFKISKMVEGMVFIDPHGRMVEPYMNGREDEMCLVFRAA